MTSVATAPPLQAATGLDETARAARLFYAFLGLHIVVWTVYATLSQASGSVHHDMTEAWVWGREWRLGYHKHPPFYAWVAALWFEVFPRADWCFYLLSAVNAGIGLAGVWALAGRFLAGYARLTAVLLLALAPFNTFMAINYNANTILLAIWPWTTFAFVRSMETGRLVHGAVFGALAAAALLSKYFSVLLLASCLAASLLHPAARRYWRTPAPYAAIATCAVLCLPHLRWALTNDLQAAEYAIQKGGHPWRVVLYKTLTTGLACVAFQALAVLALIVAVGWRRTLAGIRRAVAALFVRENAWIGVLTLGPAALTLLAGFFMQVKAATNFMIPVFFMLPVALLAVSAVRVDRQRLRAIARVLGAFWLVMLVASPAIAYALFAYRVDLTTEPRKELAQAVTRAWHEAYGAAPLRISAGYQAYGLGIPFYSPEAPTDFIAMDHKAAPWITPERIAREGLAIACLVEDRRCLDKAAPLCAAGACQRRTVTLTRAFMGRTGVTASFELMLVAPRPSSLLTK